MSECKLQRIRSAMWPWNMALLSKQCIGALYASNEQNLLLVYHHTHVPSVERKVSWQRKANWSVELRYCVQCKSYGSCICFATNMAMIRRLTKLIIHLKASLYTAHLPPARQLWLQSSLNHMAHMSIVSNALHHVSCLSIPSINWFNIDPLTPTGTQPHERSIMCSNSSRQFVSTLGKTKRQDIW